MVGKLKSGKAVSDAEELDTLLADGLVYINAFGRIDDKTQYIEDLKSPAIPVSPWIAAN